MDRSILDLIADQRVDSRNSDTDAYTDADFMRWNRHAQDKLFGLITNEVNFLFVQSQDSSIVADQADYTIDDNLSFGSRILYVEYSHDGSEENFIRLPPAPNNYYRTHFAQGRPQHYKRYNGYVKVEPIPDVAQGTLRIWYERGLDRLEVYTSQVNGTPATTDIAVDGYYTTQAAEEAKYVANKYICITDAFGNVMLRNGIISSFSTPTITLAANVSTYLETGYSLADLDNGYITMGKWSTTHSQLPNECEGFFHEYAVRRAMAGDANFSYNEASELWEEFSGIIVPAMKMADKDIKTIPIVDHDLLIPGI